MASQWPSMGGDPADLGVVSTGTCHLVVDLERWIVLIWQDGTFKMGGPFDFLFALLDGVTEASLRSMSLGDTAMPMGLPRGLCPSSSKPP